jgi:hypothetical protein
MKRTRGDVQDKIIFEKKRKEDKKGKNLKIQ